MAGSSAVPRIGGTKRRVLLGQDEDDLLCQLQGRMKSMRVSHECPEFPSPVPAHLPPSEGVAGGMGAAASHEEVPSYTGSRLHRGVKRPREVDSPSFHEVGVETSAGAAASAHGSTGGAAQCRPHTVLDKADFLHIAKRHAGTWQHRGAAAGAPPSVDADSAALVPASRRRRRDQRTTSGGSRVVLWLDRQGRVSAVAPVDSSGAATFKGRAVPVVNIPALDLTTPFAMDLGAMLEGQQLVPRHTANTFLRRAAQWLAERFVWRVPEMYDPVVGEEERGQHGSGPKIELLDEDPRPQHRGMGGLSCPDDDGGGGVEDDVVLGSGGERAPTPQSPLQLGGEARSDTAGLAAFTGLHFGSLPTPAPSAHSSVPGRLHLPHAGGAFPGDDEDVVLGVEVGMGDVSALAHGLASQFNLPQPGTGVTARVTSPGAEGWTWGNTLPPRREVHGHTVPHTRGGTPPLRDLGTGAAINGPAGAAAPVMLGLPPGTAAPIMLPVAGSGVQVSAPIALEVDDDDDL